MKQISSWHMTLSIYGPELNRGISTAIEPSFQPRESHPAGKIPWRNLHLFRSPGAIQEHVLFQAEQNGLKRSLTTDVQQQYCSVF